jgi:hypothetical protein
MISVMKGHGALSLFIFCAIGYHKKTNPFLELLSICISIRYGNGFVFLFLFLPFFW